MQKIILNEISTNIRIGITESERAKRQKLVISIEIVPIVNYTEIKDNIYNTINYSMIRQDVKTLLRNSKFNLIETVAAEIAKHIKNHYQIKSVTITIKKFPYKDTKYIAYSLTI